MSVPSRLKGATGSYIGEYRLWFEPGTEPMVSETIADLSIVAEKRFFVMRYDWWHEEKRRDGLIVLGDDVKANRCDASWIDSFHNGHRIMLCTGPSVGDGEVTVLGSYAAPPGPDWGWRTAFDRPDDDTFVMRQYNITPDGAEALAVEATYRRR
jgi:hypothetical protein